MRRAFVLWKMSEEQSSHTPKKAKNC